MASPVDPGGFDYEFVPPLDDELMCSICHLAFKDPVQTLCGHRFCRECLAEFHRSSRKVCPLDNQEVVVEAIFPDNATKRKILSSPVKCLKKHCDWIGSLSKVDNHKEMCLFEEVTCTHKYCTKRVIRSKLFDHGLTCPWRNYECIHCKDCFQFCKKEVHEQTCRQFPVKCTNRCDEFDTMPRKKLKAHLKKTCPLTLVDCSYKDIGCTGKVERNQLDQHVKSSTQRHLELACKMISEMGEKVEVLQNQNQDMKNIEAELKNVKAHQNFKGYVLKIPHFQGALQEAKDSGMKYVWSDPFYTAQQGYKFKIVVLLKGDSGVTGTHLMACLFICKGEYDAILPWPFTKEVTFTIIDQQENVADRENITHSVRRPPDDPTVGGRPTADNPNKVYSYSAITSHEKLSTRKYVVDDTLFLRMDTSD